MRLLAEIIAALVRVLLPWLIEQSRPACQDADGDRDLRDRLRQRVRRHWLILAVVFLFVLTGCGGDRFTRTIYVPDGTPVRLRETIKGAKVWIKPEGRQPVAGVMDLPEGWYALPVETDGGAPTTQEGY